MSTIRYATPIFRTSMPLAALLCAAGAAFGQAGTGGRALDANLHAYDGRFNPNSPRIEDQVRLNNAIVTGNVTGLRSFRGYVGYRAVEDFGSPLGSNDLYTFRRDSALSGISGLNIRPSDALRYQFALSTGQAPPSYLTQGIAITQREGSSIPVSAAAGSTTAAALRSTSEYLTGQSIRPALVGSRIDDQGHELTAKASPLGGINWVRSLNPVVRIERPGDKLAAEDLGSTGRSALGSTLTPPIDERRTVPGATGSEAGATNVPSPLDREAMLRPVRPSDLKIEPVSPVHAQVMDAFRSGFAGTEPGAPGTTAQPGQTAAAKPAPGAGESTTGDNVDTGLDAQLARLRDRLQRQSPQGAAETWKPVAQAKKPVAPKPQDAENADLGDLLVGRKPEKKDQPVATSTSTQERPAAKDPTRRSGNEQLTPELSRALRNTGNILVDRLSRIEVPAKPVANQPQYQAAMQSGQELFAKGLYFDAEDGFTRALASMTGDPMAKVGRIHSQLGAGLYLSAAANLRSLFADHPELIGARYADSLTPPPERVTRIVAHLREEMGRGSSALGRDAAFLLAYVGHVKNDGALVTDGLSEMSRRFDPDSEADQALLQAARAAWSR